MVATDNLSLYKNFVILISWCMFDECVHIHYVCIKLTCMYFICTICHDYEFILPE